MLELMKRLAAKADPPFGVATMNEPRCPWLKRKESVFPTDSIFLKEDSQYDILVVNILDLSSNVSFGLNSAPASDHKRGPDPEMPLRIPNYSFLQFPSNLPQHFFERWKVTGARGLQYIMQITSRCEYTVSRGVLKKISIYSKSDTSTFYSGWKCSKVNQHASCIRHSVQFRQFQK